MEHKNARKRLIYSLLIFIAALVIANVFISSVETEIETPPKKSTSTIQIDSVLSKVLADFGFENKWHKKYKLRSNQKPPLKVKHKVTLPNDVSTIEFIAEFNSNITFDDVKLIIDEEEINGDSDIEVYAADTLKYWVTLTRDAKLEREKGAFVFLLTDVNQLNKKQSQKLFFSPYSFGLLITPSSKSKILLNKINKARKEYSVILSDDIDEEIFKLEPDYATSRLERSVINIVNNFGGAINFYINKSSDIYKSTSYNFVKDEFSERGKYLKLIHQINKIEADSEEDLKSLFDFYHQSIKKNERKQLLISAEDFLKIQDRIKQIVKRGYKILAPSELNN
ncbi:MAG: hypothetical protein HND52_05105 [Ignavibacteriae bacterium]|nr:hypothetical protein [Ignavibacteriota bacterium]NOG97332.1 hypothetical protein [Ignavibacteriota bacterium]